MAVQFLARPVHAMLARVLRRLPLDRWLIAPLHTLLSKVAQRAARYQAYVDNGHAPYALPRDVSAHRRALRSIDRRLARPGATQVVWPRDCDAYGCYGGHADINSIVVFKVDHLGDFVLSIEALVALREAFPAASITLVCAPWNIVMAKSLSIFDQIYSIEFFPARADMPLIPFNRVMLGHLLTRRFDLAIDLRVDPDSRILLSCINAAYKCGYESDLCDHLTLRLERPDMSAATGLGAHQGLLMLRLVHTVADFFRSRASVAGALQAVAGAGRHDVGRLPGDKALIALNTSSGRKAKNWPVASYAELAAWLCNDMDVRVVLLGTRDQSDDAAQIAERCKSRNLQSMVGKTTIGEAVSLVLRSTLYVGNDSGLTHIAARAGVTTVAIYSGIDPVSVWAPVGPDVTVITVPTACSPCHIRHAWECTRNRSCLTSIDVDLVRQTIRQKLQVSV